MNRILGAITTLDQHFDEIANGGGAYLQVCPDSGVHFILRVVKFAIRLFPKT
jgi:hypothetical protein